MKIIRISQLQKIKQNRGEPTHCLQCKCNNINFARYAFYYRGDELVKTKKMTEGESVDLPEYQGSDYMKEKIKYQQEDLPEMKCFVIRLGFCDCGKLFYDLYE